MTARSTIIVLVVALLRSTPSEAQWFDAQMPQRGELQIGISGENRTIQGRYVYGAVQSLSTAFSANLDARLVPSIQSLDSLLADLYPGLDLPRPEANTLGLIQHDALLERTRVPISFTFGTTDWLAAFVVVPIVKGKSFVATVFDSLVATAGAESSAFGTNPDSLFQDFRDGIAALDAIVMADSLPSDRQLEAERVLADARALESGYSDLRDQDYVPTDSSDAGRALAAVYEALRVDFLTFALALPQTIPLASPIGSAEAVTLSSGPGFGIEPPQGGTTGVKFGDIEVGLSIQPINSFRSRTDRPRPSIPLRWRLDGLWRFPTGAPPAPGRLTSVGTGDGQPDVEFRSAIDLAYGRRLWLSLVARYNLQLAADLERLITSPRTPIQLGAYVAPVRWDPGDELTLVVAPRVNLSPAITFSALFVRLQRWSDSVEALGTIPGAPAFLPRDLEEGTAYTATSVGFAARFSSTHWSGDRRSGAPLQVELRHLTTVSASDGLAPKRNIWEVGLRYFWSLFGD